MQKDGKKKKKRLTELKLRGAGPILTRVQILLDDTQPKNFHDGERRGAYRVSGAADRRKKMDRVVTDAADRFRGQFATYRSHFKRATMETVEDAAGAQFRQNFLEAGAEGVGTGCRGLKLDWICLRSRRGGQTASVR